MQAPRRGIRAVPVHARLTHSCQDGTTLSPEAETMRTMMGHRPGRLADDEDNQPRRLVHRLPRLAGLRRLDGVVLRSTAKPSMVRRCLETSPRWRSRCTGALTGR